MAEIERMERMSGSNGGDVNRAGRSRRPPTSFNGSAKRGGGRGSSGRGRQFRGGSVRLDGGSRKAEARGGGADFFYEGDFSPSSGSESEYLYDRSAAPPSSPAPRGGSPVHRFNVNAPSFRPSPGATSAIGLSASAPAIPNDPLPSEVPPEEPRRRDKKGRKKMTRSAQFHVPANYLLNFTYQRPTVPDWTPAPRRRTPVVEFKKERFLQANYRFVVNAGGEYVRHLYETDQLVDWAEIEQIVLQTPVPYNCPICLDVPMAPKMTKCGHIYCWSCINRYLGMAQKGWRKCPICFDSVSTKHLKSTSIEIVKEYHEGDSITFTLMRRHKDCTVALPSEHWRTMETLLHHDDQDSAFSRLVLVDDITPILDKEQQDLNENLAQARALHDYEPVPFIEGALYELQERRQEFAAKKAEAAKRDGAELGKPPQSQPLRKSAASEAQAADKAKDKPKPKPRPRRGRSSSATSESEVSEYDDDDGVDDDDDTAGESEEADHQLGEGDDDTDHDEASAANNDKKNKNKKNKTTTSMSIMASPDIYYFYQASDGQNIFMHPLNFRCLHKEVGGSFDKLPAKVEAKVLQLEEITQNEKMRKRRKMIVGHLPLSTQFQFCEIEMGPGLASDKTLAAFADEFKFREAKRALIRREREAERDDEDSEKKKKQQQQHSKATLAAEFPGLNGAAVDDDPLLAAALEESQRMADEQAAAEAARATPPVSIPTTPATASSSSSSSPLSESPSGALQGAWAKKQLATATSGITISSSSSSSSKSSSSKSTSSSSSSSTTQSSRTTAKTPTFSQVAKNEVWSGWNEEAFPTFEAAATSQPGGGKKGGANGAGGNAGKGKKKKILLVSNAGGRRY